MLTVTVIEASTTSYIAIHGQGGQSAISPGGSICKKGLPAKLSVHFNHFRMTNKDYLSKLNFRL